MADAIFTSFFISGAFPVPPPAKSSEFGAKNISNMIYQDVTGSFTLDPQNLERGSYLPTQEDDFDMFSIRLGNPDVGATLAAFNRKNILTYAQDYARSETADSVTYLSCAAYLKSTDKVYLLASSTGVNIDRLVEVDAAIGTPNIINITATAFLLTGTATMAPNIQITSGGDLLITYLDDVSTSGPKVNYRVIDTAGADVTGETSLQVSASDVVFSGTWLSPDATLLVGSMIIDASPAGFESVPIVTFYRGGGAFMVPLPSDFMSYFAPLSTSGVWSMMKFMDWGDDTVALVADDSSGGGRGLIPVRAIVKLFNKTDFVRFFNGVADLAGAKTGVSML